MWLHKKIIHNCGSKIEEIKSSYTAFEGCGINRFIPEQNKDKLEELQCKTDVSNFEGELNENGDEILFTCQTYREGSDISGIEFVNIVIEGDKALHLIAQIKGRADRIDYPNQLSETNIFIYYKEEDTVPKLLVGLSNELDIPIYDIYDYIDVVDSSSYTTIESEAEKELREHNEKRKELEQNVLKEAVEKKDKDKSELQKQMNVFQDKLRVSHVSDERFIEICNKLDIYLLKDALDRIDEINEEYNMKITPKQIHDLNIEWCKLSNKWYQGGKECIESIESIRKTHVDRDRKKCRDMKREDRHNYYCSLDSNIPPYDEVKDLPSYYGRKYTLSDFKLETRN